MSDVPKDWYSKKPDFMDKETHEIFRKYADMPYIKPQKTKTSSLEVGPIVSFSFMFFIGVILLISNSDEWLYGLPLLIGSPIGILLFIIASRLNDKTPKESIE